MGKGDNVKEEEGVHEAKDKIWVTYIIQRQTAVVTINGYVSLCAEIVEDIRRGKG